MVPGSCRAHFDARFGRGETEASLLALMRSQVAVWDRLRRRPALDCRVSLAEFETYLGQSFRLPEFAAAWYTEPDCPLVRRCLAGLEAAGLPARTATYGFCTNGSLTAGLRGVPTVGFGVGREEDAHTVDEHVSLDKLFLGARGYTAIVGRLLGTSPVS
jgi:acetylornithine deacetylase/succinyl-diaminopimelate desuccinylase-like protein